MFDTEFLVELSFLEQSRDELLGLVGGIVARLHQLETDEDEGESKEMRLNDIPAAQWTNEIESRGGWR